MVHKTISAANELRAPPQVERFSSKLVDHSRLAGIEHRPLTRDSTRKKLQLAVPPKTNKRVCETD